MKKRKTMLDQLREAARRSGLSGNELAKRSGVFQQVISEFLRGRDISAANIQKLVDFFRVELVFPDDPPPGGKR